MSITQEQIRQAVAACLPEARQLLADLIATPSLPGAEQAAMDRAADAFAAIAEVQRIPLCDALRDDPDYSDPVPGITYDGRSNVRAVRPGAGGGRNLLLNSHLDTVPPSQGQDDPYNPRVVDGAMVGRGACDAKGQVATIYLAMAALKKLGVKLKGSVIAHIVVEEENGGNGTLAMVRHGEPAGADGCIVLEPTECRILTAIRGAVWFRVTLTGKPGHSGQAGQTRSALDMAIRVVEILKGLHKRLLAAGRGNPMFDRFENPMPLTIGNFHAGNWPATAAGQAVLEGVLGLLPNTTAREVMAEMESAIRNEGGPDIAANFALHFMYRHDSSVVANDHPLVAAVAGACKAAGAAATIDAMTASCDAWLYNNQLDIPTLVFGGGSLSVAHSNREKMEIDQLARAAEIVAATAVDWCA
ncbi:MAG: Acetylornithine deacetylase [Phycisphaerae bacterium]|nr:Acetylornithine deacetylase [Phycisphaerae bacterium]